MRRTLSAATGTAIEDGHIVGTCVTSAPAARPHVPGRGPTTRQPTAQRVGAPVDDRDDADTAHDQVEQLDAAAHLQPSEAGSSEADVEPGMTLDDSSADDDADVDAIGEDAADDSDDSDDQAGDTDATGDSHNGDGGDDGDGDAGDGDAEDGEEASTFLGRGIVEPGESDSTFIIGNLVVVIDEEISAHLPKKSADEFRRLVEQTRAERGCRNDIVVCQLPGQDQGEYTAVDGMHRIKACCETQGLCGVRLIQLTDRAAVERWVRENQLAQRNLGDDAKAYYFGQEYLDNLGHQGERNDLSGRNVRRHTGEEVGADAQVDERTIRRWADFAKSLDELAAQCGPAIRQKVLAGEVKSAQSVIARIIKLPRGQRRTPVRHVVEHGVMPPVERTPPSFVEKLTRTWEKADEDDRRQFLQALLADEECAQMIADLQEQDDED